MLRKRTSRSESPRTAGALLAAITDLPPMHEDVLHRLEEAQRADRAPEDPWLEPSHVLDA